MSTSFSLCSCFFSALTYLYSLMCFLRTTEVLGCSRAFPFPLKARLLSVQDPTSLFVPFIQVQTPSALYWRDLAAHPQPTDTSATFLRIRRSLSLGECPVLATFSKGLVPMHNHFRLDRRRLSIRWRCPSLFPLLTVWTVRRETLGLYLALLCSTDHFRAYQDIFPSSPLLTDLLRTAS